MAQDQRDLTGYGRTPPTRSGPAMPASRFPSS